jgi:hypothetical protein
LVSKDTMDRGYHQRWHPTQPLLVTPLSDMMYWHHLSLALVE